MPTAPGLISPAGGCASLSLCLQELELFQVREVYRCLLHSILFNRALGWVRPRETECEVLQRTCYARIDDPALVRAVDKNVDALYALIEKHALAHSQPTVTTSTIVGSAPHPHAQPAISSSSSASQSPTAAASAPAAPIPATLSLSFYESAPSKSWFGPAVTKLYWERWVLPCSITYDRHAGGAAAVSPERSRAQEERFRLVMTAIITLLNDKRDHLPPVKAGQEGLTYSFECECDVGRRGGREGRGGGWGRGWGGRGRWWLGNHEHDEEGVPRRTAHAHPQVSNRTSHILSLTH